MGADELPTKDSSVDIDLIAGVLEETTDSSCELSAACRLLFWF